MDLLNAFCAYDLLQALALVNAAKSKEASEREECLLVEYYSTLTNDIVALIYLILNAN